MIPLRQLRKSRTITQAELARLLDIPPARYAQYENARIPTPFAIQQHITAILGVGSELLFKADNTPEVVDPSEGTT